MSGRVRMRGEGASFRIDAPLFWSKPLPHRQDRRPLTLLAPPTASEGVETKRCRSHDPTPLPREAPAPRRRGGSGTPRGPRTLSAPRGTGGGRPAPQQTVAPGPPPLREKFCSCLPTYLLDLVPSTLMSIRDSASALALECLSPPVRRSTKRGKWVRTTRRGDAGGGPGPARTLPPYRSTPRTGGGPAGRSASRRSPWRLQAPLR